MVTRIYGPSLEQLERRAEHIGSQVDDAFNSIALTVSNWYRTFDDINIARTLWLESVNSTFLPLIAQAYDDSAVDTWEQLNAVGDKAQRSLTAALIPKFIGNLADAFLQGAKQRLIAVGDLLWNAMRLELLQGEQFGENFDKLQARLVTAASVATPRARNATQTEIIGASNTGSFQQMKIAQVVALKTWIARKDDRTRQSHRDVDGTQVDMNTKFIVGGYALDYPHDPTAPPEEIYNCRCTLVWEIVEEGELTDELVIQSLAAQELAALTAAARDDKHNGAMIALVPREAEQLALPDFEPADELHVTLFYLGDAADITPTQINELVTRLAQDVRSAGRAVPIFGRAFGVAHWNPESDYPAWVLNVGDAARDDPSGLEALRESVEQVVNGVGITYPAQHSPWQPHICIAYSKDDLYGELASRLGPVTFDTLRVAWGEYDIDIPLVDDSNDVVIAAADDAAFHLPGKHNQKSHGRGSDKSSTNARDHSFDEKINSAKKGNAAFNALSHSNRGALLAEYEGKRGNADPDVDEMSRMIGAYQGPAFSFINSGLRNPDTHESTLTNADMGPVISGVDTAMKLSETTDDIVTYRGIRRPGVMFAEAWNEAGDNAGLEWVDDGYMSTTTDKNVTDKFIGFVGPDSVIMRMLIPKGTRALAPDLDPTNSDEKEIVVDRGQRARVVRDYRDPVTNQRMLDVEVVQ